MWKMAGVIQCQVNEQQFLGKTHSNIDLQPVVCHLSHVRYSNLHMMVMNCL